MKPSRDKTRLITFAYGEATEGTSIKKYCKKARTLLFFVFHFLPNCMSCLIWNTVGKFQHSLPIHMLSFQRIPILMRPKLN